MDSIDSIEVAYIFFICYYFLIHVMHPILMTMGGKKKRMKSMEAATLKTITHGCVCHMIKYHYFVFHSNEGTKTAANKGKKGRTIYYNETPLQCDT